MRLRPLAHLALLVEAMLLAGAATEAPRFEDYPAAAPAPSKPAAPKLVSREARRYRTVLREAAREGPNFAGHFTIAQWGCGAGCITWAIIDASTGTVWVAPFTISIAAGDDALQDLSEPSLDFRPDSELVVAKGARNEEGRGTYWYRWHAGSLSLLQAVEHAR